jgi:hypothetical protein
VRRPRERPDSRRPSSEIELHAADVSGELESPTLSRADVSGTPRGRSRPRAHLQNRFDRCACFLTLALGPQGSSHALEGLKNVTAGSFCNLPQHMQHTHTHNAHTHTPMMDFLHAAREHVRVAMCTNRSGLGMPPHRRTAATVSAAPRKTGVCKSSNRHLHALRHSNKTISLVAARPGGGARTHTHSLCWQWSHVEMSCYLGTCTPSTCYSASCYSRRYGLTLNRLF